MRSSLLYNPRLLLERLGIESIRRRRTARLKHTPARKLSLGHVDTLELIDLAQQMGIGVIYDIGANVGTWTLLAKALIPFAQVRAFEPLEDLQQEFRENTKALDGVTLHGIALGAEDGAKIIHRTELADSSSLLSIAKAATAHFGTREIAEIPITLRRLDEYCREENLPWPDLIKLDVQGYELEVLRGGRQCLKKTKAVIAEVSFVPFYEGQCLFDEVVQFMHEEGFSLRAFGVNTALGQRLWQTDVLFSAASNASSESW